MLKESADTHHHHRSWTLPQQGAKGNESLSDPPISFPWTGSSQAATASPYTVTFTATTSHHRREIHQKLFQMWESRQTDRWSHTHYWSIPTPIESRVLVRITVWAFRKKWLTENRWMLYVNTPMCFPHYNKTVWCEESIYLPIADKETTRLNHVWQSPTTTFWYSAFLRQLVTAAVLNNRGKTLGAIAMFVAVPHSPQPCGSADQKLVFRASTKDLLTSHFLLF